MSDGQREYYGVDREPMFFKDEFVTPEAAAEAMRAKCERVAEIHSHRGVMDYDLGYIDGRKDASAAIAALKVQS